MGCSAYPRSDTSALVSNALLSCARTVSNAAFRLSDILSSFHYGIPESHKKPKRTMDALNYGAADLVSRFVFSCAWGVIKACDLVKEGMAARNYDDIASRFFKIPVRRTGFRFQDPTYFCEHRSGWNYAMYILQKEFSVPHGILFVDFAEKAWGWRLPLCGDSNAFKDIDFNNKAYVVPKFSLRMFGGREVAPLVEENIVVGWEPKTNTWLKIPFLKPEDIAKLPSPGVIREPYVTVFHNPPNMPQWFDCDNSPECILNKPEFKDSLPMCKGIFVFSQYLAAWLRERLPESVPVSVVKHPTEDVPESYMWDSDAFEHSVKKPVVQLGWWLRKLGSIYKIDICDEAYEKIWLYGGERALDLLAIEAQHDPDLMGEREGEKVKVQRLDNYEYDELLKRSVVLVDLYDSSCNNAILECIVRHTPVFVKRLPATIEYLGEDYPLLFNDLKEVEDILDGDNVRVLIEASEHLKMIHESGVLNAAAFEKQIKDSDVFKRANK